jgi:hypothetical protein
VLIRLSSQNRPVLNHASPPLMRIVAIILFAAGSARALGPGDDFDSLKITPPNAWVHSGSVHTKGCGRATDLHLIQIKVDDIYSATPDLARVLDEYSARPLSDGCISHALWENGVDFRGRQIRVTRWLDRKSLFSFTKEVLKIGTGQYIGSVPGHGQYAASVIDARDKLKKQLSGDSELGADANKRSAAESELRELESRVASIRDTESLELVHVYMWEPRRYDRRPVAREVEGDQSLDLRTFAAIVKAYRSRNGAVRAKAIRQLARIALRSGRLESSIGGVGLQLTDTPRGITVSDVINGMAADRAGVERGDIIEEINENPHFGVSLEGVKSMIRGPSGSRVVLTVRSPADDSLRVVELVRESLQASSSEIAAFARECMNDDDPGIRSNCLTALAISADLDGSREAVRRLLSMMTGSDERSRSSALAALRSVWGISASEDRGIENAASLPHQWFYNGAMEADAGCRAYKGKCNYGPKTACLVTMGSAKHAGIKQIELLGPGKAAVADFDCSINARERGAVFGPFCNMSPGTYTKRLTTCAGVRSESRHIVHDASWDMQLCMRSPSRGACTTSAPGLIPGRLPGAEVIARMEVELDSNTVSGVPKRELCAQFEWTFGGDCAWRGDHSFFREAAVTRGSNNEFFVFNHGVHVDALSNLSFSLRVKGTGIQAKVENVYVAAGEWLNGKYRIPHFGQVYPVKSEDGIVEFRAPFVGPRIETAASDERASTAYKKRKLQPAGGLYWLGEYVKGDEKNLLLPAHFLLVEPALLSFTYKLSQESARLAIYRFDGSDWTTEGITGLKFKRDPDNDSAMIQAHIVRSGLYASDYDDARGW